MSDDATVDKDTEALKEIADQVERERESGAHQFGASAETPEPTEEDQPEADEGEAGTDPGMRTDEDEDHDVPPDVPPAAAAHPKPLM